MVSVRGESELVRACVMGHDPAQEIFGIRHVKDVTSHNSTCT